MSQHSTDSSLLSTFDWLWENDDFIFLDSESAISQFDDQLLISIPPKDDSNFANTSNTSSPEEGFTESSSSSEAENIAETIVETKSKPTTQKRKTRGQELPIPTTNLPPRKRAKTDAEKEQRRIERVLRNRAAAQSSRERKQKVVESLKTERDRLAESNSELKARLLAQEAAHTALCRELEEMKQMLRRYEEFQNVEATARDPRVDEGKNHFLFPNREVAAPVWTVDPIFLDRRGVPGQTESTLSLDVLA